MKHLLWIQLFPVSKRKIVVIHLPNIFEANNIIVLKRVLLQLISKQITVCFFFAGILLEIDVSNDMF